MLACEFNRFRFTSIRSFYRKITKKKQGWTFQAWMPYVYVFRDAGSIAGDEDLGLSLASPGRLGWRKPIGRNSHGHCAGRALTAGD